MESPLADITTGTVHLAQKLTAGATYGGASSAVYFGLNANEIAAFGGLFVAVLAGTANVLINLYFKQKHYQLAEIHHRKKADGDA